MATTYELTRLRRITDARRARALENGDAALPSAKARRRAAHEREALALPAPVIADGARWVVVYCGAAHVRETAQDLEAIGFRTYAPMARAWSTQSKRGKDGRWVRRLRQIPVFGGYLFVGELGEPLTKDLNNRIVHIIGDMSGSLAIPACVIDAISRAECEGKWDYTAKREAKSAFFSGQQVRLTSQVMQDFVATVEAIEKSGKIRITGQLFGGKTVMRVDEKDLKPEGDGLVAA
jgi:transcription termination factor NusG